MSSQCVTIMVVQRETRVTVMVVQRETREHIIL